MKVFRMEAPYTENVLKRNRNEMNGHNLCGLHIECVCVCVCLKVS